ncbi:MAG TPA: PAS domain-containing sensor histidine kinase, partial [Roseiflexaceae bacterium]|nr:PAS domain-containing sensor histidine kinase [Roseiflexaceae bacterium]
MHESRPLIGSARDIVGLRRIRLLNLCLLVIGLLIGASAGAGLTVQLDKNGLGLATPGAVLLIGGAVWLIVAFVLSRRNYVRTAGALVVGLAGAALTLTIYLLPGFALSLLPFAALPVVLAALLVGHRSIFLAAALTILAVIGAFALAGSLPPPDLGLGQPSQGTVLVMWAVSMLLLALALAPLRREILRLLQDLQQGEQAQARATQGQADAERGRAEAEAQLAWQQRHTATLLDNISDGAIAVDATGRVTNANAAARALWVALAGGDILDKSYEQVGALLAGPSAATAHVDIVPLGADAQAEPGAYTHVLRDQREHARMARLRGELLGLLTSEMRNPLTSMITALEMTLGQNLPEGADRVLVGARRSGQRLLDLVTTMQEIDQIERGPEMLQRSAASLRPVVEAGIAQTAPLAQQGAVTVVVEYGGDGKVVMDAERLRRAFVYLLEHAVRHSPPYSTVQVRIERQNGTLLVRISDQGAGMNADEREALFTQQYPLEGRNAPPLGLAFSKLLIEKHG